MASFLSRKAGPCNEYDLSTTVLLERVATSAGLRSEQIKPKHWFLLIRSFSVDIQVYVIYISNEQASAKVILS